MTNPLARDLDAVLEQAAPIWDDLRGARLFITGGTGFFGCWLLETLLWANDRLKLGASAVVLTRDPGAFARKAPHMASNRHLTLHCGDVRTFAAPDGAFTHVVHAAVDATGAVDQGGRLREFETTVQGTLHALEFARRAGAARFLLTSSGSVYGPQPRDLLGLSEDHLGGPDTSDPRKAGAEAKRASEMLVTLYASGQFVPTVARCFAFVGPYLPLNDRFAIGNFIRDAMRGGPVRVLGDGTAYRSYLYASDLAVWLWTILVRGASGRTYNVGGEQPITIADLAHAVARVLCVSARVEIASTPVPARLPDRYVPSTARARAELGLTETVGLDEGVGRTAMWHRQTTAAIS
jgi:nucleoside-diphosphate-sugar epimerase